MTREQQNVIERNLKQMFSPEERERKRQEAERVLNRLLSTETRDLIEENLPFVAENIVRGFEERRDIQTYSDFVETIPDERHIDPNERQEILDSFVVVQRGTLVHLIELLLRDGVGLTENLDPLRGRIYCSTDCPRFCQGDCPFERPDDCPRYKETSPEE